jgi:hypothetical protein
VSATGYCTGYTPATDHETLEERAHRARRIARVLRHDLDRNPPADLTVRAAAEARCRRYGDEAAAFEVALKIARGW